MRNRRTSQPYAGTAALMPARPGGIVCATTAAPSRVGQTRVDLVRLADSVVETRSRRYGIDPAPLPPDRYSTA